jgi:hypothetical protein
MDDPLRYRPDFPFDIAGAKGMQEKFTLVRQDDVTLCCASRKKARLSCKIL